MARAVTVFDNRPARRVFVSHTGELRELPGHRSFIDAVVAAIIRAGDVVVDMEYWTAADQSPVDHDRDRLANADVYVLLAGFRYGSPVRGRPELSYTEHEFEMAGALGLPRLVFLLSERVEGPAALFTDDRYGARQSAFRRRLQDGGVVTGEVDSPDRAETLVYDALLRLPRAGYLVPGASTAVPTENSPVVVHGRDRHIEQLLSSTGAAYLLFGAGGMGKSTIGGQVGLRAPKLDPHRRVWWVRAGNEQELSSGLVSVARELGMTLAEQETIRTAELAALGDVADRFWRRLNELRERWILILDNADDPALLGPADGTGWIRRPEHGLLLITSRNGEESRWPHGVRPLEVGPLSLDDATQVLLDLAPDLPDPAAARDLAERLGCLPLALRTAGIQLRQPFARWSTFGEYCAALNRHGVTILTHPQRVVTETWEMSLEVLGKGGRPQARPLLWFLSCFAPGAVVPQRLTLDTPELHELLRPTGPSADCCSAGLTGLHEMSLIHARTVDGHKTIDLHPFIAETTHAVMTGPEAPSTGSDPERVWAAVLAATAAVTAQLAPGTPVDWSCFRLLTPHIRHLLATAGPRAAHSQREALLDQMTRCITSYLWSRAEPLAESLAIETLATATALGCTDTPSYLRLRVAHAWAVREQHRFPEAEDLFRQILARQVEILPGGGQHPDVLRTRHHLAWTMGRQGAWAQAADELADVIRLSRLTATTDDVDILHTRCMLSWATGMRGQWQQATTDYQGVHADRARLLGQNHPDTLDTLESMGKAYLWQGLLAHAGTVFDELAEDRLRSLGEHPDTLLARQLTAYTAGLQASQVGDQRGLQTALAALQTIYNDQLLICGPRHHTTMDTQALATALRTQSQPPHWPIDLPAYDMRRTAR